MLVSLRSERVNINQHSISPHSITVESNLKVIRIKRMLVD